MIADNRLLGFVVLILISTPSGWCGVTQEQMRASGKMIRDVCQPKFKLSDEVADGIRDGIIPDDQNVKCYINCVMEMMNAIKKGKFNYEASIKQVDLLVSDDLKDGLKAGMTACKNSIDGVKNHCEAATTLLKCLVANTPNFTFA